MIRATHAVIVILLVLTVVGLAITFGIRALQTADLLPTRLNASSGIEYAQAQVWNHTRTRLTEVLWPAYWLLLSVYWLFKTYLDKAIHRIADALLLLPCAVFVLLVTNAFGLKTWMWG